MQCNVVVAVSPSATTKLAVMSPRKVAHGVIALIVGIMISLFVLYQTPDVWGIMPPTGIDDSRISWRQFIITPSGSPSRELGFSGPQSLSNADIRSVGKVPEIQEGYSIMDDDITGSRIFMYTAFWDERPGLPNPVVRVITVISRNELNESLPFSSVNCFFAGGGPSKDVTMVPGELVHYGGTQRWKRPHPRTFHKVLITCALEDHKHIPHRVTVVPTGSSTPGTENATTPGEKFALNEHNSLPIEIPERSQTRASLGMCVPLAFGHIDPYRLVEWFEINRILGVSQFFVYNYSLSVETAMIMEHYAEEGILQLRPCLPLDDNSIKDIHSRTTVVVNDCLYRNMYKFQYLLVLDFDDLILPQHAWDLHSLVTDIQTEGVGNYRFRHTDVVLDLNLDAKPDETQPVKTAMLRYRHRVPVSAKLRSEEYHQKSITNPRDCQAHSNHQCKKTMPNTTTMLMPEQAGLDYHFRKYLCDPNSGQRKMKDCKNTYGSIDFVRDDVMLKYKDVLINNMNRELAAMELQVVKTV